MREETKQLEYLENMPIAFCVIRVDLDASGNPNDFVFTYVNRAHTVLEGTTKEELLGKSFYEVFQNADRKWLNIYYRTAYEGIPQQVIDYSPEIGKYLSISTYQPEYGYCGCTLQDITKQAELEQQVERSNERARLILQNITDAVFWLDLETRTLINSEDAIIRHQLLPKIENFPCQLLELGLIRAEGVAPMENCYQKLKSGENEVSCEIEGRLHTCGEFSWYRFAFSAYMEVHTDTRQIMGYLCNIDDIVKQRQALQREAQADALTGLYNVKAGRTLVEAALIAQPKDTRNAFFMFDLDNFKHLNDSFGHEYGDQILLSFASHLRMVFEDRGICFRVGGDEFAAFLPEILTQDEAEQICMEIFSRVRGEEEGISVSVGCYAGTGNNYNMYYKGADSVLYRAKSSGKNAYQLLWC